MKLIEETIVLPAQYSATAESEELRNALVLKSRKVTQITTASENAEAGQAVRNLRTHIKGVEAVRVELTKPLLEGQRLLKALADDHCSPLKDEVARVEALATNYMEAEQRRVAAAEALRRKQFEEAEAKRIAAEEAARKAAEKMTTPAGLAKAEKLEAKAIASEAAVQTIIAQPRPEMIKAKGQSMKQVLKYEVLDIRAVYAARPELCTIEIKPSAVLSTCVPEFPVPGMKLWYENKATFASRTPATPATITPLIENDTMNWIKSESSQISHIAHDASTNTLHVKFHSGGHYSYANFPADKFEQFKNAPSHGQFLGKEIIGKHEFKKHA